MTYTVLAPAAIVAIAGLLIYALAGKAEVKEIGRLMFGAGILACLLGAPALWTK